MKANLVSVKAKAADVEREIQASQRRVEKFEAAFKELAEVTGIAAVPEIVRSFVEGEDTNFRTFDYIQARVLGARRLCRRC